MVFKSQSNLILHYALVIGIILLLAAAIILFIRRKTCKKLMIPVFAVLVVLTAACIFNSYHYGVKKIVFPVIKGDNEYTAKTEIKGYLKWLNSLELQEVEYDIEHDPSMLAGQDGCADVVYNNGAVETYIYGAGYLIVRKGEKREEKQLYRIIEEE